MHLLNRYVFLSFDSGWLDSGGLDSGFQNQWYVPSRPPSQCLQDIGREPRIIAPVRVDLCSKNNKMRVAY